MGTYSYYEDQDITITDLKGLKEYIKVFEERFDKERWLVNIFKDDEIRFREWSEVKLIEYWYNIQLVFLEGLTKYIEGWVTFDCENDNKATITFSDEGELDIEIGTMEYNNFEIKQLMNEFDESEKELEQFYIGGKI